MADLYAAATIMLGLSIAGWVVGRRTGRRFGSDPRGRWGTAAVAGLTAASLGLLFGVKDRLWFVEVTDSSAAIVYSNLTPILLATAAGVLSRLPQVGHRRRLVYAAGLLGLAGFGVSQPMLLPVIRPAEVSPRWTPDGVAMQSHEYTCSAAAAATLLSIHDIRSDESEMTRLCLTDGRGTPSLGLWRGLCLATRPHGVTPRRVSVAAGTLMRSGPHPAVVTVGLPPGDVDPVYQRKYGWPPGLRHSVVLLGHRPDEGLVEIADPSIGKETWSEDDFRVLYRGEAIALVPAEG